MGLTSEVYMCRDCNISWGVLLDRGEIYDSQECPNCGELIGERIFSPPNVSTSKTSKTIPDVVASGRFGEAGAQHEMNKEKGRARGKGDFPLEREINKEIRHRRRSNLGGKRSGN